MNLINQKNQYLEFVWGIKYFLSESEEGQASKGLGFVKGNFTNFNSIDNDIKTPHAGWNECKILRSNKLYEGIKNNSDFLFTHSYILKNFNKKDVLTTTDYTYNFVSSIQKQNVYGVQFHLKKVRQMV